jgi:hypothetical protein
MNGVFADLFEARPIRRRVSVGDIKATEISVNQVFCACGVCSLRLLLLGAGSCFQKRCFPPLWTFPFTRHSEFMRYANRPYPRGVSFF